MTDTKTLKVATIIPGPQSNPNGPHLAQGTKVILSDGSELSGVAGVTLRAEAGGLWKATIEVYPREVPTITALAAEDRWYASGGGCLVTKGCANVPLDEALHLEPGERVR
ncbi:Uncharacterized protein ABJ99_4561 [Pseudomonas syringae pv. cilantro]|uniref:Uncharacterized protein n=2 Tax=Pseudomonas syringae group TaxID=136849 RepID=A0A0N0GFU8_PSESX|nr:MULTISPECIES: hypothetical protein [Pseudomonas syringae group]KPC32538.1 Uncharacterized protein ABJ99_4561 [Pseudomonas syringae pv. cilantro]KPW72976.1 Uncharacterized protein ALO76_02207 [Pseudomonas syringae pv. coriandricola]RMN14415.1 hypothetical protein ALQ65_04118 [Pseudomonas syringae pv. coriandricola]